MIITGESIIRSIDDFRSLIDPETKALGSRMPPDRRNIFEMHANRIDGVMAKYFEEMTRIATGSNRLWTEDLRYDARRQAAGMASISLFAIEQDAVTPLRKRIGEAEAAARARRTANTSEDRLLDYWRAREIREDLQRIAGPGKTLNSVDNHHEITRLETAASIGADDEFLNAVLDAPGFQLLDAETKQRVEAVRIERLTSGVDPLREEVKHYEYAIDSARQILQPLLPPALVGGGL